MTLLLAYGNPGRGDDGLGPAFAARIAAADLPGVTVVSDYQLTVDHALTVSEVERVVFADASLRSDAPFEFAQLSPAPSPDLSSHSLTPAAVLALSETLYGKRPEAFVLGIAGSDFGDVKEGLSPPAERNLCLAETFFLDWIATGAQGSRSDNTALMDVDHA